MPLLAQAFDAQGHHVAFCQEYGGGFYAHAYAGWGAVC